MSELQERTVKTLLVVGKQPLYAIPVDKNGQEDALYATDEAEAATSLGLEPNRERIKLAGAWSYLDWSEAEQYFDRINGESEPTPPIADLL